MRDGSGLYWLLTDHLGSTAVVATSSGAWADELRYTAWGETRESSGALPTDYRFTGQRWQNRIGLYDYQARWYDPALGRFVQPDTIVPEPGNPQDLNRFTYARNNPLYYADPSGHFVNLAFAASGAAIGAVIGAVAAAGPQIVHNVQQGAPLTANLDTAQIAKAAAIGAATGAVSGLTFGVGLAAGSAAAGMLGITGSGTVASTMAGAVTVGVSGAASGQASRAASNVLQGRDPGKGLFQVQDMALDAATSMVAFKAFGGRFDQIPRADLNSLGPFGKGTTPAGKPHATSRGERAIIQRLGQESGCHTCGQRAPKFYADHIDPSTLAPQCPYHSNFQGWLRMMARDWMGPNHIWSGRWWIGSQSSYWQLYEQD